jgi:hypothetical protein
VALQEGDQVTVVSKACPPPPVRQRTLRAIGPSVLDALRRSTEQFGFAFVLGSTAATAIDVDDGGVVEEAIAHRCDDRGIAGENTVPPAEGKVDRTIGALAKHLFGLHVSGHGAARASSPRRTLYRR